MEGSWIRFNETLALITFLYKINTVSKRLCKTNAKTASVFMLLSDYIFHEVADIIDEILLTN